MGSRIRLPGLIVGLVGSALVGWFIYSLLSSVSCTGPACDVSTPTVLAFPVGFIMALAGVFTGGGFLIFSSLFFAIGLAALAVGAFHGMPEMPAFPWWFGGMFVAGGMLPFILGFAARRGMARKQIMAAELMQSGVRGIGTIIAVEDTGITLNEQPRIVIRMRIEPDDRSAPVERSKKVTVSRVAIPRPGERYPAWFDRADPDKWMFATAMDDTAPADIRDLFARARDSGPPASLRIDANPNRAAAGDEGEAGAGEASAVEELAQLSLLWKDGALTDAEFEEAKARLLPRIGR